MPFFGLVWTTSWVSYFLASSQGLLKVPDSLASVLPSRAFSVASSPLELQNSRFFAGQLDGASFSSSSSEGALSKLAWQPDTGTLLPLRFQPAQANVSDRSQQEEKNFCPPASETKSVKSTVAPSLDSEQKTSGPQVSQASLPQQILQVMQNLLPWRQLVAIGEKASSESVAIVSTHSGERVSDKKANKERHLKRGFWHYSQMLKSKLETAPSSKKGEQFQVWLKERSIAQFPTQQQAELMAKSLKQSLCNLSELELKSLSIEAALVNGAPIVKAGDRLLFEVNDALAKDLSRNRELLAIEWANNLRLALGQSPLNLTEAQQRMYNLVETSSTLEGIASWYGPYFHGRLTATGETYNEDELTAAHPSLPFDTYLKVKNLENGNSVIVRINDRGPYIPGRSLDLSRQAARSINSEKVGIIPFEATIMKTASIR
ncbi:MAG TPA: hypothetical protein DDZ80_26135 [Cyanobacteria bacterium UBA8803]|nr:hypothetical protein [Cyanobacteria bacterium UBA9273]HBL61766.1 hypothetical protein [Cyanobacteria bacterium UBA8803]